VTARAALHARLERIARDLRDRCADVRFGAPVAFTYHPLEYAWHAHRAYLRMARPRPAILFVGMNPGPFGMVQTGVPFGEIAATRDFLAVEGRVRQPKGTHPKRPIEGFACRRAEVSGQRFWGLFSRAFATREDCFRRIFVWNYCPLAFMSESGANITPDKLPRAERDAIGAPCDRALREIVALLRPRLVVGVGAFARAEAERALAGCPHGVEFAQILHPSPASPAANRGWDAPVRAELAKLGVIGE